jgi:hypothetical protein
VDDEKMKFARLVRLLTTAALLTGGVAACTPGEAPAGKASDPVGERQTVISALESRNFRCSTASVVDNRITDTNSVVCVGEGSGISSRNFGTSDSGSTEFILEVKSSDAEEVLKKILEKQ